MFFGLCNSPATFQGMMNDILWDLIDRGTVMCYMDDILVHTKTRAEHCWVVWEVLDTLCQHKLFLKLKPEKCQFEQSRVNYLGLIISKDHIEMDPAKVQGVLEWPMPQNVKDIRSFLGFINFYCHFICNFSNIARPLNALTWKTWKWSWGDVEHKAFEALKQAVTSAPILVFPSSTGHFWLECDTSNLILPQGGCYLNNRMMDGIIL